MLEHKRPHCSGELQVGCLLLSARFGWIICSCSVSSQLWEQSRQKEILKCWERECKCLKFGCLLQWVVCNINWWGWWLMPVTLELCLPGEVFSWKAAQETCTSAVTWHRGRGQHVSCYRQQCIGPSPEQLALCFQDVCLEQCHILCFVQSHPRPWAIGNWSRYSLYDCCSRGRVTMESFKQLHLHRNPRN